MIDNNKNDFLNRLKIVLDQLSNHGNLNIITEKDKLTAIKNIAEPINKNIISYSRCKNAIQSILDNAAINQIEDFIVPDLLTIKHTLEVILRWDQTLTALQIINPTNNFNQSYTSAEVDKAYQEYYSYCAENLHNLYEHIDGLRSYDERLYEQIFDLQGSKRLKDSEQIQIDRQDQRVRHTTVAQGRQMKNSTPPMPKPRRSQSSASSSSGGTANVPPPIKIRNLLPMEKIIEIMPQYFMHLDNTLLKLGRTISYHQKEYKYLTKEADEIDCQKLAQQIEACEEKIATNTAEYNRITKELEDAKSAYANGHLTLLSQSYQSERFRVFLEEVQQAKSNPLLTAAEKKQIDMERQQKVIMAQEYRKKPKESNLSAHLESLAASTEKPNLAVDLRLNMGLKAINVSTVEYNAFIETLKYTMAVFKSDNPLANCGDYALNCNYRVSLADLTTVSNAYMEYVKRNETQSTSFKSNRDDIERERLHADNINIQEKITLDEYTNLLQNLKTMEKYLLTIGLPARAETQRVTSTSLDQHFSTQVAISKSAPGPMAFVGLLGGRDTHAVTSSGTSNYTLTTTNNTGYTQKTDAIRHDGFWVDGSPDNEHNKMDFSRLPNRLINRIYQACDKEITQKYGKPFITLESFTSIVNNTTAQLEHNIYRSSHKAKFNDITRVARRAYGRAAAADSYRVRVINEMKPIDLQHDANPLKKIRFLLADMANQFNLNERFLSYCEEADLPMTLRYNTFNQLAHAVSQTSNLEPYMPPSLDKKLHDSQSTLSVSSAALASLPLDKGQCLLQQDNIPVFCCMPAGVVLNPQSPERTVVPFSKLVEEYVNKHVSQGREVKMVNIPKTSYFAGAINKMAPVMIKTRRHVKYESFEGKPIVETQNPEQFYYNRDSVEGFPPNWSPADSKLGDTVIKPSSYSQRQYSCADFHFRDIVRTYKKDPIAAAKNLTRTEYICCMIYNNDITLNYSNLDATPPPEEFFEKLCQNVPRITKEVGRKESEKSSQLKLEKSSIPICSSV